jgi:trehalose-phosphatase
MEYLKDALKRKVVSQLHRAKHVFFFLDYDGTLTSIMPKPEMVKLKDSTRKILEQLSTNPNFSIAIITGRKIEEIESLVPVKNIIFAGNHGLELKGPAFHYVHAKAKRYRKVIRDVLKRLQGLPKRFVGSFIEDKKLTLSYHFRGLREEQTVPALRKEFMQRIQPWLRKEKVEIVEGKKVFEIRPHVNWNKGSAVRWMLLRENPESLPIYIGDDKTDEHAFKALNDCGITIRVGLSRNSHAQYFVKDVYEVEQFLSWIARFK